MESISLENRSLRWPTVLEHKEDRKSCFSIHGPSNYPNSHVLPFRSIEKTESRFLIHHPSKHSDSAKVMGSNR